MTERLGSGFECLEERTLLAANVAAVVTNGTLTVTGATSGANANDDFDISGDGVSGHVTLDVNGAVLMVNGVIDSDGVYSFTGIKNIVVNTGTGNDNVDLYDLSIIGNVTENGGAGNDSFDIHSVADDLFIGGTVTLTGETMEIYSGAYGSGVTIAKNVTMNGGTGNDLMAVYTDYGNSFVTLKGSVTMNGGSGNDQMFVTNADSHTSVVGNAVSTVTIIGNVNMNGGDGNDYGFVANWSDAFYGDINVNASVLLNGGNGNDFLALEGYGYGSSINVTRNVVINGGSGNDTMRIASFNQGVEITAAGVTIHGNAGDDLLNLHLDSRNNQTIDIAGQIDLEGDLGDDTLTLVNYGYTNNTDAVIETGSLLVHGNDGDDFILAYGIDVVGNANLWGDNGDDSFFIVKNNVLGNLYVNGWFGVNDTMYDNLNYVKGTFQTAGIEFII